MRTYQRLVIARGGSELSTVNPAYPHNFVILNDATGIVKIGSTGVRYNSLIGINGSEPEEFMAPREPLQSISQTPSEVVSNDETATPSEIAWPPRKGARRKKKEQADDSSGNTE